MCSAWTRLVANLAAPIEYVMAVENPKWVILLAHSAAVVPAGASRRREEEGATT